jgi:hypothetical protein
MSSTKQSNSESIESKSFFNRDFWIKISFIAVSALLWFLTKLSQDDYTDNLQYRIEFQNQQTGKVISDVSIDAFDIEVEGNGYDLLSVNTSFQNTIVLSLDEAEKIDENTYSWDTRKNLDVISSQLPSRFRVKKVSPKTIVIKTDNLEKRTVEVVPVFSVNLDAPLRVYNAVKVIPSKIDLWVPSSIGDSAITVSTEDFLINDDVGTHQMTVGLKQLPEPYATNPLVVDVKYEIRSFTQKVIEVPVEVENLPLDGQVRLFPDKVKVTMNISQEDYDLISVKDFKCVADFKELDAVQNRISLSLEKIPEHIELIDWGQKSAEFIIIKK